MWVCDNCEQTNEKNSEICCACGADKTETPSFNYLKSKPKKAVEEMKEANEIDELIKHLSSSHEVALSASKALVNIGLDVVGPIISELHKMAIHYNEKLGKKTNL